MVTPYRPVDPPQKAAPKDPFEVDPDVVDRGLRGHATTQETLAQMVRSHGLDPLSPGAGDPNFDLAWENDGTATVVEVKSLTSANKPGQLRLGLGQLLDCYRGSRILASDASLKTTGGVPDRSTGVPTPHDGPGPVSSSSIMPENMRSAITS